MTDNVAVASFINSFGYVGLGVVLAANCVGVPIASELVLPLAGVYAMSFGINLATVVIVAIIGQMLGFTAAYFLALNGGVDLLEKYGKYLFLNHRGIVKFHKAFKKHGLGLVVIGSCVPGVHGYMGFTAGLAEMGLASFLATILAGTVVWTVVLVSLGAIFKEPIASMVSTVASFGSLIIYVLIPLGLIIWYIKLRNLKHRSGKKL